MSKNNKIPQLNLTTEEIAEVLKNLKIEDLLPKQDLKIKNQSFNCPYCHDTGVVEVYGPGPNRPCFCKEQRY